MKRSNDERRRLVALGRAVRKLRIERKMSTCAVATASGLSRSRITSLEAGRADPRLDMLHDLARGLGIQVHELVARAEHEEKGGGA